MLLIVIRNYRPAGLARRFEESGREGEGALLYLCHIVGQCLCRHAARLAVQAVSAASLL